MVEIRVGNENGSADVAAREEKLVCRLWRTRVVVDPPIRVHCIVARAEISFSMKIAPACFGYGINDDGPFGVLRAEVRRQHLKLLNHVRVRVDRSRAVAAGVRDVGAVSRNINVVDSGPVRHISAVQWTLAAAVAVTVNTDHFAGEIRSAL